MDQPWRDYTSQDGRKYWYNTITKASTWTKPAMMMSPAESAMANQPWKEYATQDGRKYWHNPATKQSVWEMPDEYKAALDTVQKPNRLQPFSQTMVSSGISGFVQRDRDNHFASGMTDRMGGYGYPDGSRSSISMQPGRTEYTTSEEAEAAFMKVLRKVGVQPEWSWEDTIRAAIRDPQYRALNDPRERRLAWEKYVVEVRLQEKDKARERFAKLRSDFNTMLKSHPEITYDTSWKTAKSILQGEAIFKAASTSGEQRQLFHEYRAELKKAEADRKVSMQDKAMQEIKSLLTSMKLEPYSRWKETEALILEDAKFRTGEHFKYLEKIDILKAFEEHIKGLERTYNDVRQREKLQAYRRERINRDNFKELLGELEANGKIDANTKWADIYPYIEDDPRYDAMLGQPGSTPLDFFRDVIVEEELALKAHKSVVLDILEDKRFEISLKTEKDEFLTSMRNDHRAADISDRKLSLIFERLKERVQKRNEEDKHLAERQQRRMIDALRSRIKHLEPPVTLDDTWEQVRARIERFEEYSILNTDDLRRSAYEKHLRRMKEKEEYNRNSSRKDYHDHDHDHRNGYSRDRRHRTRTPEVDAYEADRRKAQADREKQYLKSNNPVHSPTHRRYRDERDRYDRRSSRQGSLSHYDRERRERDAERERSYTNRADPREKASELDYGDSKPTAIRRRRDSDGENFGLKRDTKRNRHDRGSHERTLSPNEEPQQKPVENPLMAEEVHPGMRSGSEEGEIEEDQ